MHYRVFYMFDRTGEAVSSASAVEMSAQAIREQLLPRFQTEDDYLGIIDQRDNTLQILQEGQDEVRFWVELPIDAARASYGRHMSIEEVQDFMRRLPQIFDRTSIPGLAYRPW